MGIISSWKNPNKTTPRSCWEKKTQSQCTWRGNRLQRCVVVLIITQQRSSERLPLSVGWHCIVVQTCGGQLLTHTHTNSSTWTTSGVDVEANCSTRTGRDRLMCTKPKVFTSTGPSMHPESAGIWLAIQGEWQLRTEERGWNFYAMTECRGYSCRHCEAVVFLRNTGHFHNFSGRRDYSSTWSADNKFRVILLTRMASRKLHLLDS